MNCIFCKANSDTSTSREHIIPESLGNKEHILPVGIVCDSCNNYFATKIEQPLLGLPYFEGLRSRQGIPSKRKIVPPTKALLRPILPDKLQAHVRRETDGSISISAVPGDDERILLDAFRSNRVNGMYLPAWDYTSMLASPAHYRILSRFVAKVGLEVLASRLLNLPDELSEGIVGNPSLDPLRNYARFDIGETWRLHIERLYREDHLQRDPQTGETYEILHEYDIHVNGDDFFIRLTIAGVEYVLNLGNPACGYRKTDSSQSKPL